MVFEFISEGSKGKIPKVIKFSKTNLAGMYNLAFGDRNIVTGEIDDKVISNHPQHKLSPPPTCVIIPS